MHNKIFSALLLYLPLASPTFAGVIGLSTVVSPPFTTETTLTGHRGYILSLMTDDGSNISAVDVTITGQLHQRWSFNADTELYEPTPSSANITGGDSHLNPIAGALVGSALTENNNISQSPLADTFARDYGYGNLLKGAWGIPGSSQSNKASLAYIVIPDGTESTLQINAQVATPNGTFSFNSPLCTSECGPSIFPSPAPGPGIELNFGSLPLTQNPSPLHISLASHPFDPDFPVASITLSGPDAAKFELTGTLPTLLHGGDLPQIFGVDWRTPGQPPGVYNAQVLVNITVYGSPSILTFDVQATVPVPEPASLALAGLALTGLGYFRRKPAR